MPNSDDLNRLYRNIIGPLTRLAGEMEGTAKAVNHADVQKLADTIDGWSEQALSIRDAVAEELDFPTRRARGDGEVGDAG